LPPIGDTYVEKSPAFANVIAELDKPMRFKEPLTSINLKFRQKILDYFYKGIKINEDYSFENDKRGLYNLHTKDALFRNFLGFYDEKDISSCKIIAYRNETVDYYNDYYNDMIRLKLLGNNTEQIQIGDIIVANKPYNNNRIKNRTTLKVTQVEKGTFLKKINIFKLIVEDEENKTHIVKMLDKSDMSEYWDHLNMLKNNGNYIKVGKFRDSFINYSFNFASTSHTAQGSNIKNVFVDLRDILSVKMITSLEKAQSIYVAISRAKEKLFILK